MLKYAKNGMFEAIINHENEQARPLGLCLQQGIVEGDRYSYRQGESVKRTGAPTYTAWHGLYAGAFVLALALTVMTFIVLRRTVIHPLLRAAQRIEQISEGDLTRW